MTVLFDWRDPKFCHQDGCCPVAIEENGVVAISHPDQPEKGSVTMTPEEWNEMVINGRIISTKNKN